MRIFKKSLLFVIANGIAILMFSFLLTKPPILNIRMKDFASEDYSTVIMGHSLGSSGIDPHVFSNGKDTKAYNMCSGGLSLKNISYLLPAMDAKQDIRTVYLDLYYDYWTKAGLLNNVNATRNVSVFQCLPFDLKVKYFGKVLCNNNYNDVFFRYRLSISNLSNISENIRIRFSSAFQTDDLNEIMRLYDENYVGQGFTYVSERKDPGYTYHDFDEKDIDEETVRAFDDIVEYCKENNIELICFISALPVDRLNNENHEDVHNFYKKLCDNQGVALYDMNYVKYELLPREKTDYIDSDGHMLGALAERQTKLLKEIVASNTKSQYFEDNYNDILLGITEEAGH